MNASISILDEMEKQGLLTTEGRAELRAKQQQAATQQAIANGDKWWEAKARETGPWYSGNRPDTSNDQFIKDTGGPSYEQIQADERNRGLGPNKNTQASRDDFAAWQQKQEWDNNSAVRAAAERPTVNHLAGLSPDQLALYQAQQAQIAKNNREGAKIAAAKREADYRGTLDGKLNMAKRLIHQIGLGGQQAYANATAAGNPNIDPGGFEAATLMPGFAGEVNRNNALLQQNAANNANRADIANINAGVVRDGHANRKDIMQMQMQANENQANRQRRDTILGQLMQDYDFESLPPEVQQEILGGFGSFAQSAPRSQPANPYSLKIPQLPNSPPPMIGPQQGPQQDWWNQSSNAQGPWFKRKPPTPEQQAVIDNNTRQGKVADMNLETAEHERRLRNDPQYAADFRRKHLAAQANNPGFIFSSDEKAKEVNAAAMVLWAADPSGKTPIPVAIESGLKALYTDDDYDDDNSKWRLFGRGGWSAEADANTYGQYVEKHYGVPRDIAIKFYNERIRPTLKTVPQGVAGDVIGNGML